MSRMELREIVALLHRVPTYQRIPLVFCSAIVEEDL